MLVRAALGQCINVATANGQIAIDHISMLIERFLGASDRAPSLVPAAGAIRAALAAAMGGGSDRLHCHYPFRQPLLPVVPTECSHPPTSSSLSLAPLIMQKGEWPRQRPNDFVKYPTRGQILFGVLLFNRRHRDFRSVGATASTRWWGSRAKCAAEGEFLHVRDRSRANLSQ